MQDLISSAVMLNQFCSFLDVVSDFLDVKDFQTFALNDPSHKQYLRLRLCLKLLLCVYVVLDYDIICNTLKWLKFFDV